MADRARCPTCYGSGLVSQIARISGRPYPSVLFPVVAKVAPCPFGCPSPPDRGAMREMGLGRGTAAARLVRRQRPSNRQ